HPSPSAIRGPPITATIPPLSSPTTRSRTSEVLALHAAGPAGEHPGGPCSIAAADLRSLSHDGPGPRRPIAQGELHDLLDTRPDEREGLPCPDGISRIRGGDARRGDRVPLDRTGERLPARGGIRERGARAPLASALVPGPHGRRRGDGRGRGAGAPHRHPELSGCRSSPERLGPR